MPTRLWRGLFRFWLSVVASDPDKRRAARELLRSYDDVYRSLDRVAIEYDGGIHVKHRLTRYHDFFLERVQPGEQVLDIGSGKGELAHDRVTFLEGNVLETLPGGDFDVVVLSNVLEHLGPRVDFLRRIVESARPKR